MRDTEKKDLENYLGPEDFEEIENMSAKEIEEIENMFEDSFESYDFPEDCPQKTLSQNVWPQNIYKIILGINFSNDSALTDKAEDVILELMATLPPRVETIMRLHYKELKSFDDIAKELNIDYDIVCERNDFAIRKLRLPENIFAMKKQGAFVGKLANLSDPVYFPEEQTRAILRDEDLLLESGLSEYELMGTVENINTLLFVNNKTNMFVTDYKELVSYDANECDVEIPEGVTEIRPCAFSHKYNLRSVVIPDTVKEIGEYAFYFCFGLKDIQFGKNLKSIGKRAFMATGNVPDEALFVDLPDSVEFIGEDAFANCNCIIDALPQNLKHIGAGAFWNCYWFAPNDESEWYAAIPDTVTTIEDYAFAWLMLANNCNGIWIPLSVKKIGKRAFFAPHDRHTICYEGSEEQWNAIDIDNSDGWLKNIDVKFNSTRK